MREGRAAAYALALLALAAVVWASLVRDPPKDPLQFRDADKVKHLAAYLVLSLAWSRALGRTVATARGAALAAFALGAAVGAAIEVVQPRFGRSCDLLDGTANAAGAALGALLWSVAAGRAGTGALIARLASALACASLALAPAGVGGCAPSGPKQVRVVTAPGRSAGMEPVAPTLAASWAAGPEGGAPASGGDPARPDPPGASAAIPLAPDEEARLIEQAGVVRMSGPALARDFYDALLERVAPRDRAFFAWLRARLEPERAARAAALRAALRLDPALHGAWLDVGDMALEEGRLEAARLAWEEAQRARPGSPRALARLAYARERHTSYAAAAARALDAIDAARGTSRLRDPFVGRVVAARLSGALGLELLRGAREDGIAPAIASRFAGERLAARGDLAAAALEFEQALLGAPPEVVPWPAFARATLARIARLAAEGNPLLAEEVALAAAERDAARRPPAPPVMAYAAALAALRCGSPPADVARRLERAAAADPPGAPAARLVSLALDAAGLDDVSRKVRLAARLERSPSRPPP